MRKNKKTRKRLTFHSLKQVSRLMFAFLSSLIIIVNCKEEEQKKQMEQDTKRMEAFFESFDEDVETLAMTNLEPKIAENLFADYTQKAKYREYELAIAEYSMYFNLDSEKVFELTRELTNDFSEPLTITIGRKSFTATNAEDTAMFITCDVWKDIYNTRVSEKKYNLKKEDYVTSEEIVHVKYDEKGNIVMRSGLTFNQLLGKASSALGKSPALALAISDHESGHRHSPQARNKNNFAGIKGSGVPVDFNDNNPSFAAYPSPEAGTIYHAFNLERMENTFSYNNLYEFASIYVWGTKTISADNWYNDVNHQAAIYASNEEYYFGIPEEKEIENEIQLALTKKGYNYQVDLD